MSPIEIMALILGSGQLALLLDIRYKLGGHSARLENLEKRTDKLEGNPHVKHLKRAAALR